jgi:hypothetical protein
VRGDPMFMLTDLEHKARETFLLDVMDTQQKLAAQATAFATKRTAATGAEQQRLNALAEKLGFAAPGAGGGRGGRGGRGGGGGGPAAAGPLGGIVGNYTGSGVRHGSFRPPTTQMKAALTEAKRVLAELDKELGAKKP